MIAIFLKPFRLHMQLIFKKKLISKFVNVRFHVLVLVTWTSEFVCVCVHTSSCSASSDDYVSVYAPVLDSAAPSVAGLWELQR